MPSMEQLKKQEKISEQTFEMQAYNNARVINLMGKRGMLQQNENPEQAFERAINALDEIEKSFNNFDQNFKSDILNYIDKKQIVLGTPIITNAGRENRPTSACVVIPIDLRADLQKIKESVSPYFESAMGSGFDFSELDNPVEKLKELNNITKQIEQNCERPVASMGMLRVNHPRILEFINAKKHEDFLEWRFNISVSITDDFMQELKNGSKKAKKIFKAIAESAHYCGEPGILFMNKFEKDNPTPEIKYHSVAPCAEIAMAPGEVCQFSYINLSEFIKNKNFDFDELIRATKKLTRLLDNSVEISIQNAVADPEIIASKRRIGIGLCGLADLFIKLNMKYDSKEAGDLSSDIMATINYYSKQASLNLAQERGKFSLFDKSRYKDKDWTLRKNKKTNHVGPDMWEKLWEDIAKHGLRNAGTTALPPTGTSSRLVDTSASIEPRFTLTNNSGQLLPQIKQQITEILQDKKYSQKNIDKQIRKIEIKGSVQGFDFIPEEKQKIWATASQININGHFKILEAVQNQLDESVSKTFNLPRSASAKDVEKLLLQAYKKNFKGITVFRDGCLQERNKNKHG